jgi:hypothetical protein
MLFGGNVETSAQESKILVKNGFRSGFFAYLCL